VADDLGIQDYFSLDGPSICMNYVTRDASGSLSMEFRTLFAQEMVRNGVLIPWISPSLSHGDDELQITLDAARKALRVYKEALNYGVQNYLEGPAIKSVFRKYN
jgi:glutamate-1-semialdehyde 2,1-aminomutase